MTTLFCECCEEFFETTEDLAHSILEAAADPDTCHINILCDVCELEALAHQDDEEDYMWSDVCVYCGDALPHASVGVHELCRDCYFESEHPHDEIEYDNFDQVHDPNSPF